MLDMYYMNEQPLPLDDEYLQRVLCVRNTDEIRAYTNVLRDFFERTENGYIHSRCDRDLARLYDKSDKARASVEARWAKVRAKQNNDLHTDVSGTYNERNTNAILPNNLITHRPITKPKVKTTVELASQTQPSEEKKSDDVEKPVSKNQQLANEIFEHWKTVMNHPRSVLGDKTSKLISARLKEGFTVDMMKQAIDGCSKTPHNMGQNDRNTRYDSLDLILRDSGNVNRFIANAENPPVFSNKLTGAGNQTALAAMKWLESDSNDFDSHENLTEKEVFESKDV
jgi:uncharacterized protein YdaU (DUF1376 family)